MKVEVEVLEEFTDGVYGKKREVGDIFVCSKELALKRRNFMVSNQTRPLIKILRVVPNDTPEEEKVSTDFINMFKEKMINKKREET